MGPSISWVGTWSGCKSQPPLLRLGGPMVPALELSAHPSFPPTVLLSPPVGLYLPAAAGQWAWGWCEPWLWVLVPILHQPPPQCGAHWMLLVPMEPPHRVCHAGPGLVPYPLAGRPLMPQFTLVPEPVPPVLPALPHPRLCVCRPPPVELPQRCLGCGCCMGRAGAGVL